MLDEHNVQVPIDEVDNVKLVVSDELGNRGYGLNVFHPIAAGRIVVHPAAAGQNVVHSARIAEKNVDHPARIAGPKRRPSSRCWANTSSIEHAFVGTSVHPARIARLNVVNPAAAGQNVLYSARIAEKSVDHPARIARHKRRPSSRCWANPIQHALLSKSAHPTRITGRNVARLAVAGRKSFIQRALLGETAIRPAAAQSNTHCLAKRRPSGRSRAETLTIQRSLLGEAVVRPAAAGQQLRLSSAHCWANQRRPSSRCWARSSLIQSALLGKAKSVQQLLGKAKRSRSFSAHW